VQYLVFKAQILLNFYSRKKLNYLCLENILYWRYITIIFKCTIFSLGFSVLFKKFPTVLLIFYQLKIMPKFSVFEIKLDLILKLFFLLIKLIIKSKLIYINKNLGNCGLKIIKN
jgi:hypothetical protein